MISIKRMLSDKLFRPEPIEALASRQSYEANKSLWGLPVRSNPFFFCNSTKSSFVSATLFESGQRSCVILAVLFYFLFGFSYGVLVIALCFGTFEVFETDTEQEYLSYATPGLDKSVFQVEG